MEQNVFEIANNIVRKNSLAFLEHLIPGGEVRGQDYLPLNPTRNDKKIGSLTIDLESGQFIDYAEDSFRGGDFVALTAIVKGISQKEAAQYILKYDGQTENIPKESLKAAKKLQFTPIIPAPVEPDFSVMKRYGREYINQMPSDTWIYHTKDSGVAFIVARYELDPEIDKNGRHKLYTGWTYGKNGDGVEGWMNKFPPAPRLLYHLPDIIIDAELPIVFCEGEKAAEAASILLPNHISTTVPNGAQAASKTDLSPCAGRKILLWPDNDKAGADWIDRIGFYVHNAGAAEIQVLDMKHPSFANKPEKWDAANAIDDGWTAENMQAIIDDTSAYYEYEPPEKTLAPLKPPNGEHVDHADTPDEKMHTVKKLIADENSSLKVIASAISLLEDAMDREELVTMAAKSRGWSKGKIDKHVELLRKKNEINIAPEETKGRGNLNIESLSTHYIITERGVWPSKRVTDGDSVTYQPDYFKVISTRPFWPNRLGVDAKTKEFWVELAWKDARSHERKKWMKATDLKSRKVLLELDGLPVTDLNFKFAAQYLDTAIQFCAGDMMPVYTSIGWADGRWHWPSASDEVVYAGPEIGEPGSFKAWLAGLKAIVELEDDGYLALACVGMSIASCMSAVVSNERSPVIGLTQRSSSGKGTILNFAMSVWGDSRPRRFETGSTQRGIEDRSVIWSNIPVFADDLHNMRIQDCQNLLYFLGTGRQRTTSSTDMTARGGRTRMGTAFYAAESNITEGMKGGAQKRVWELRGSPLPANRANLAYKIQGAYEKGAGALAPMISDILNNLEIDEVKRDIWTMADKYRDTYHNFEADDGQNLGLMRWGLNILEEIVELDIPIDSIVDTIAHQISSERVHEDDLPRAALREIVQTICGMVWPCNNDDVNEHRYTNCDEELRWMGENIAWRRFLPTESVEEGYRVKQFEFNHRSKRVIDILNSRYEGYKCVVGSWVSEGWVVTSKNGKTQNLPTVRKRGCGWVTRLTEKGMAEFLWPTTEPIQQAELDLGADVGTL